MNSTTNTQLDRESGLNVQSGIDLMVWPLLVIYAFARVLEVYPGRVPMLAVVALHVFPPAVFAIIHGRRVYRPGGILFFLALTLEAAFFWETLGIRTGFPFGRYYFTNLMGPKLGSVPVMLGIAYVGMAYLSWTLARITLADLKGPVRAWQLVTLPLLASCIMVSWDLSQEPIWSTVLHAWIWERGGKYFGVPLSNFRGWFLTVYSIYQLFALYLMRRPMTTVRLPVSHWRQAIIFYGASAAGNLLLLLPQSRFSTVTDSAGTQWRVSAITEACVLVTLLTMGIFTLLTYLRLRQESVSARLIG